MAGNKAGAKKAIKTIRQKHGDGFYATIGAKGGAAKTKKPKGFAGMPKWKVSAAGRKGGSIGKPNTPRTPEAAEIRLLKRWER